MVKVRRICKQCGKQFEVKPSVVKRGDGIFCSRKCRCEKVKKICEVCGKIFWLIRSREDIARFCSRDCYYKWRSTHVRGKNHPGWNGGKIERVCVTCGAHFFVNLSDIKRGWGKFCTLKCKAKWQSEQLRGENSPVWRGGQITLKCEVCGKEFQVNPYRLKNENPRFCSLKCMGKKYEEERKGEKAPAWKGGKVKRICLTCGNVFEINPARAKRGGGGTFCSISCARQAQKMPTHHTKPEMVFEVICKKYDLPFKYTGDGAFWIGKNPSVNPDFMHLTKKIVVEIFSWHHDELRNRHVNSTARYDERKKLLKKRGYKMIVFWQDDLEREDAEARVLSVLKTEGII